MLSRYLSPAAIFSLLMALGLVATGIVLNSQASTSIFL